MAAPASREGAAAVFSLLRAILRLHRERLPPPMRSMGDTYAVSEFRRHLRSKTSEEQWRVFEREWRNYAAMLGGTADQQIAAAAAAPAAHEPSGCGSGAGAEHEGVTPVPGSVASVTEAIARGSRDVTEELLEHMSLDQRRQLIKLQQEALALGAELLGKASPDPGGPADGMEQQPGH
jgi:hypothetical protein